VRVLLVEDEPDAARMLAKGLREQAYAVDVASDARSALERAHDNEYDAVVLDVLLPDGNGREVCRTLRSEGVAAPVLMLTALGSVQDRINGLDAGADDYLAKPFDFGELLARLRALIRRGSRPPLPEVLQVDDLSLDTRGRRVTRAGREVALTTREYALLEFLVRRAGDVVSRSEIAEHVWDERFDPLSNVIDVYVQRLRRKVDDGRGESIIRTRRGEGYQLNADRPAVAHTA
jgi:two-component system copper resistance phosphate regulon response regulator CusR